MGEINIAVIIAQAGGYIPELMVRHTYPYGTYGNGLKILD
jgi:hypothetical protein